MTVLLVVVLATVVDRVGWGQRGKVRDSRLKWLPAEVHPLETSPSSWIWA